MVFNNEGFIQRTRCLGNSQHGYAEPADMAAYNNLTQAEKDVLREQRKKDGKALFYIHQAMHESILPSIAAKTNAK